MSAREILFIYKEEKRHHVNVINQEQVSQRSCGISIVGDKWHLTGHDPEEPALTSKLTLL